ncbi:MAG TPA: choice-of-anchor Q domain-containing protein, partial [Solirubrobacteraceae bacterium]
GVFRLTLVSPPPEDANAAGDLDVSGDLTITGAGGQATTILAVFSGESDRVIQATGNASLTLTDLTVSGGRSESSLFEPKGGGIDSEGSGALDLEHVVVSGNTLRGMAAADHGAGIYKGAGTLTIDDSAVVSNSDLSLSGNGAGAYIAAPVTASITNTTFANNFAGSFGGAIDSEATMPLRLAFVTVTGNQAQGSFGGGGIVGEPVLVRDSIIAGNSAPEGEDCKGFFNEGEPIVSEGGNVAGPSCGFTQASDVTTTSPMLGALEGSPIPYLEPLAGSPALDRALAPCPATDVRGVVRPQGSACDSGAVERVVATPSIVHTLIAPGGGKPTKTPSLTTIGQSRTVWRAGNKLASVARRIPVGTVFSFSIDQSATVVMTFTQSVPGRRVHGRCVAPRPTNRAKRHCKRTVTRGTLSLAGHAGTNFVSFQGRISRSRKLAPGSYTVHVVASNAAGRSKARTLSFTIVK